MSKVNNRRCKVNGNLSGVSSPSISAERDHDKQQTDQLRGRRRSEEIEIRPSLQFIHKLVRPPFSAQFLAVTQWHKNRQYDRKIEGSPLPVRGLFFSGRVDCPQRRVNLRPFGVRWPACQPLAEIAAERALGVNPFDSIL